MWHNRDRNISEMMAMSCMNIDIKEREQEEDSESCDSCNMSYEEILEHIDRADNADSLLISYGITPEGYHTSESATWRKAMRETARAAYVAGKTDAVDDGYTLGYEAAASDPKAWYILDKDGAKIHFGEEFKADGQKYVLDAFEDMFDGIVAVSYSKGNRLRFSSPYIEKVDPDERKQVEEELARAIYDGSLTKFEAEELANMYAEKLIELGRNDG